MAVSLVMRIEVVDEDRWRAYRDAVLPVVAAFGGTHVTGSGRAEQLEAPDGPKRLAVFSFRRRRRSGRSGRRRSMRR